MLKGQARLARWHRLLETRDFKILDEFLAEDVVFHTPVYLQPRQGKEVVSFLLRNVFEIFVDFTYHRELINDESWALEFSAKVDDRSIKGIDLIRWNENGQIVDFEVYVRPANGIEVLAKRMLERIQAGGMLETILEPSVPT